MKVKVSTGAFAFVDVVDEGTRLPGLVTVAVDLVGALAPIAGALEAIDVAGRVTRV